MFDTDIAVVGAGVAGLAAATSLRQAGLTCVVLEAGTEVGGRARTSLLAGAPFDHGASWLHQGESNPLTPLARAAGLDAVDFSATRVERIHIPDVNSGPKGGPTNGHWATTAEQHEAQRAETRLTRLLSDRATRAPDISLAKAASPLQADPWTHSLLQWEGAIIAAADADRLSLKDWHANLLLGHNLCLREGIGSLVARHLAPPAGEVRLGHAVTRIDRTGPGVLLSGAWGSLRARAVIVTVSTGVLASGAIRFDPPLPIATQEAIAHLPMGLLSKVGLAAAPERAGKERLGVPNSCSIWRRRRPGEPALVMMAWPLGRPYIAGHFGGQTAWDHTNPAEAEALVRAELVDLFGHQATTLLNGPAVVTDWGTNPRFLGAYAYAPPGFHGARAALGTPIDDGRVMLAGEACHATLAGTVGGAWLSGQGAARQMTELIRQPA